MKVVVDDAYTSDPDTVVNILDVNELRKLDIYISYIE
jgi:hypothetical protein